MSARRTLSVAAAGLLLAGGAAAWTLIPSKVQASAPAVEQPAPVDLWAKGPLDRDNMVRGVLDYRSAPADDRA